MQSAGAENPQASLSAALSDPGAVALFKLLH